MIDAIITDRSQAQNPGSRGAVHRLGDAGCA
jgi:hypothetical protein